MINLENITLVAVEGVNNNIDKTIKVLNHCTKEIIFGDIVLISPKINENQLNIILSKKIRHHEIPSMDWLGYNNFILKKLYDYIKTDYCLIVQWDGFILNPNMWDDEFLKYDYIGASWDKNLIDQSVWVYDEVKKLGNYSLVGNGGFSLRSKKLLEISKNAKHICYQTDIYKYKKNDLLDDYITMGPEDAYICINHYDYFVKNGIKFAPTDVANKFSREGNKALKWELVFGFHGEKDFINNI